MAVFAWPLGRCRGAEGGPEGPAAEERDQIVSRSVQGAHTRQRVNAFGQNGPEGSSCHCCALDTSVYAVAVSYSHKCVCDRSVIFVSNNNHLWPSSTSSSPFPAYSAVTGYQMLVSCMDRATLSCIRGGLEFRPCAGMGRNFTGRCMEVQI